MSGLVRTHDEYVHVLEGVRSAAANHNAGLLAVDTETTGLHPYQGDVIRGVSVAWSDDESWYVPLSHPNSTNFEPFPLVDALNLFTALRGSWILHHSDFDLAVLTQLDFWHLPPAEQVYDTQAGMWLDNENVPNALKYTAARLWGDEENAEKKALDAIRKGRPKSDCNTQAKEELRAEHGPKGKLKDHREWLDARSADLKAASQRDWPTFTAEDIGTYAALDADQTWRIYHWQQKRLFDTTRDDCPGPAVHREMLYQRVIYDMIRRGVRVDTTRAELQCAEAQGRMAEIEPVFEGVNLRSSPQLAVLIYDRWGLPCTNHTAQGARSTDRASLEALEGYHEGIDAILEHKRLAKAVSGFYEPMLRYVGEDGRIHPAFRSTRTVTGRLSCSEPNLQTIPQEGTIDGVKQCFIPADGMELWEYDLAGAELRIIASYAREEWMIEALEQGRDLHSETATDVFGPDFTPLQRRVAKNINFTAPYFGGPKPIAKYMAAGPPRRTVDKKLLYEAELSLDRWKRKNRKIHRLMNYLQEVARRDGIVPLHVEGIYRRFHAAGVVVPYHTALNAVVQGGIGQYMRDIMLEAERQRVPGRMVLQVHDSLWYELAPGQGEIVQQHLQGIAEQLNPFKISMRFDAKVIAQ